MDSFSPDQVEHQFLHADLPARSLVLEFARRSVRDQPSAVQDQDALRQGRDLGEDMAAEQDGVLLGKIDQDNLADLTRKIERYIDRRIRTLVLEPEEFKKLVNRNSLEPRLLLWRRRWMSAPINGEIW